MTRPGRPHYVEGRTLRASDLVDDRDYRDDLRRQHDQLVHGLASPPLGRPPNNVLPNRLRAGVVAAPSGGVAVVLGSLSPGRPAGLTIFSAELAPPRPVITLTAGSSRAGFGMETHDTLSLGQRLSFEAPIPSPTVPLPWTLYLTETQPEPGPADSGPPASQLPRPELRAELVGGREPSPAVVFAVGPDRTTDWIRIAATGTTAITGNLVVQGSIRQAPLEADPDDPRFAAQLAGTLIRGLETALVGANSLSVTYPNAPTTPIPRGTALTYKRVVGLVSTMGSDPVTVVFVYRVFAYQAETDPKDRRRSDLVELAPATAVIAGPSMPWEQDMTMPLPAEAHGAATVAEVVVGLQGSAPMVGVGRFGVGIS
jgi:hypothetical protein